MDRWSTAYLWLDASDGFGEDLSVLENKEAPLLRSPDHRAQSRTIRRESLSSIELAGREIGSVFGSLALIGASLETGNRFVILVFDLWEFFSPTSPP